MRWWRWRCDDDEEKEDEDDDDYEDDDDDDILLLQWIFSFSNIVVVLISELKLSLERFFKRKSGGRFVTFCIFCLGLYVNSRPLLSAPGRL